MAVRDFDRKLGKEYLAGVPLKPGVYRFFGEAGELIYVGKAKSLRRRLAQYRNARRLKAHFKMRAILKEFARLEWSEHASELEACMVEQRLIQTMRPKWNVAGAFHFMYPMVGLRERDGNFEICLANRLEVLEGFEIHGAFRSRHWTGSAFFAWAKLLRYVGHGNARSRKRTLPRGCHQLSFRRVPARWVELWSRFFRGDSPEALEQLVLALIESSSARRSPRDIQDWLNALRRFWRFEVLPLKRAREKSGMFAYPVPQADRDFLFIQARYGAKPGARAPEAGA